MPEFDAVKDSGERRGFGTGSVRDVNTNKGAYHLLPTRALRRLAQHFQNGAKKYKSRNWELGQPLSNYMDSGLRHAFNHLEGKRDEDHMAASVWNFMCLIETQERIEQGLLPKELNDLDDIPSIVPHPSIREKIPNLD
jgi:hypothetical protein